MKAETITLFGTVFEPKIIYHDGEPYYLKYAATKTLAKMRRDTLSWEKNRYAIVQESTIGKGFYGVYLGPKIKGSDPK